jgi:hypothetical protein
VSTVAEMFRVLLPRSSVDGVVAMITAYFDDTGTHQGSPVIGFGGLVGNEEQWYLFEGAWRAKLAAPLPGKPPLERFHMSDCMAYTGEFENYSEPERDAVIHDFRQMIIASGVWGYGAGVSQADWNELIVPANLVGWVGDAEAICFRQCVAKIKSLVRQLSPIDKQLSLPMLGNRCEQMTSCRAPMRDSFLTLPDSLWA